MHFSKAVTRLTVNAELIKVRASDGAQVRPDEASHPPVVATEWREWFPAIADQCGEKSGREVTGWVQNCTAIETITDTEASDDEHDVNGL